MKEINETIIEISNTNTKTSDSSFILDLFPDLNPVNLKNKLKKFISTSKSKPTTNLQTLSNKIHKKLQICNENHLKNTSKPFSIDFLEHSHYIFSLYNSPTCISQEDLKLLEERKQQFSDFEYPYESYYKLILKILQLTSFLLCKWKIFDINNYWYRYKGRSLTVKIVNISAINDKCISADIIWFSFAIRHQPFYQNVEKILLLYSEILHFSINNIISFLHSNNLADYSFPFPRSYCCCKKPHPVTSFLYESLKSFELSYRSFEQKFLEECLKLV